MLNLFFAVILPLAISALTSFYCIPILVFTAKKLNITSKVNPRSASQVAIPLLGGVAISLSMMLSVLLLGGYFQASNLWVYIIASVIIIHMGLKDDIFGLSPGRKLLIETLTILLLCVFGYARIIHVHGLFQIYELPQGLSIISTIFIVVLIMNAFNLSDGIDGLASGIGIIASTTLGIGFYINEIYELAFISFSLTGGLISFFYFNVFSKKNKLLMGDTGSLFTGLMIALLVIQFNEIPNPEYFDLLPLKTVPIVIFSILIYPLVDLAQVVVGRLMIGKHPFHADRNHLHHKLLNRNITHKKTTMIILGVNLAFIIMNLLLNTLNLYLLIAINGFAILTLLFIIDKYSGIKRSAQSLYVEYKQKDGTDLEAVYTETNRANEQASS